LKRKELSFLWTQKSSQECEKKEVRCWRFEVGRENRSAPPTPPGILYEFQNKGVAKFAFCNLMRTREIVGQGESSHGRERKEQARIGFDIHGKE
jgi:hypothetical protein